VTAGCLAKGYEFSKNASYSFVYSEVGFIATAHVPSTRGKTAVRIIVFLGSCTGDLE
jgi:hypothetical protein